jgi:hypothetical protein
MTDPDAPLSPEEQEAYDQQGAYLSALEDALGPDGVDDLIRDALSGPPE